MSTNQDTHHNIYRNKEDLTAADCRRAVATIKAALDRWLAAIENPLGEGAIVEVDGATRVLLRYGQDFYMDGEGLIYEALHDQAIASHGGAPVPECPGDNGGCGSPVAKGSVLCPYHEQCEREKSFRAVQS